MGASSTIRQKTTSSFRVDGWTGDIAGLDELTLVCRKLLEKARKDLRNALQETVEVRRSEFARVVQPFQWDESKFDSKWETQDQEDHVKAELALELTLTAKEAKWSRERKGSPEHVLPEIDARDVKGLTFVLGKMYGELPIGLSIDFDRNRGCAVEIISFTPDFVLVATDALRPVLVRRRPWYWWIRSYRIGTVLWILPMLFFEIVSISSLLATITPGKFLSVLLPFAVIDTLIAFGIMVCVRAVLPGVEIFKAGERARGTRILAAIGAAVLWTIPIVIPYLLR